MRGKREWKDKMSTFLLESYLRVVLTDNDVLALLTQTGIRKMVLFKSTIIFDYKTHE
jgi:hypothetical protein